MTALQVKVSCDYSQSRNCKECTVQWHECANEQCVEAEWDQDSNVNCVAYLRGGLNPRLLHCERGGILLMEATVVTVAASKEVGQYRGDGEQEDPESECKRAWLRSLRDGRQCMFIRQS